jgi:DNA primase RepB-like protein
MSKPNLRIVDDTFADEFDRWVDAVEFLKLFGSDQHVFQLYDDRPKIVVDPETGRSKKVPRKGRADEKIGCLFDGEGQTDLYRELVRRNRDLDCAITFAVNNTDLQGRKRENIVSRRAIFNEHDESDVPNFPLPPSLTVESSPGKHHFYWLTTDDIPSEAFAGLLRVQIDQYGSDPGAKDETRVLRVPGFYHRKGEPFLVSLGEDSGRRYTAQGLIDAFKPKVREPDAEKPRKPAQKEERVRANLKHVKPKDRGHLIGTLGAIKDEFGNSGRDRARLVER